MTRKPAPKKTTGPRPSAGVSLRELSIPKEASLMFPLIRQLNPDMTKAKFLSCLKEMLPLGYRVIGAFDGKKLIGCVGLWTATRFWCGKYMEMDNVVVDINQRSGGIGKLMVEWVEARAKQEKCNLVMADSYTHNHASHRFYFREGYIIKGYCFVKETPPNGGVR
jgi:N-acetylglutamate synthase-like GNAT family acetyltransferase